MNTRDHRRALLLAGVLLLLCAVPVAAQATPGAGGEAGLSWWAWTAILFVFTLGLGVVAVIAGVGGGVLFVPIVYALFPFHLDFVRGAGLMVALCGALSAGPSLLKQGLASMRLAIPFALCGSVGSIVGASVGLALPASTIELLLGITIVGIVAVMLAAQRAEFPEVKGGDKLAAALAISGVYRESSSNSDVKWQIHRSALGLVTFVFIGFLAGMFGLGAGWANVPALNLLLGAPLKIAVATSGFVLSINDTAAAWVYLNSGAVLPLIVVPSVAGMMIGTRIGASLLGNVKPRVVKWVVIGILFVAGVRSLLGGLGVWSV